MNAGNAIETNTIKNQNKRKNFKRNLRYGTGNVINATIQINTWNIINVLDVKCIHNSRQFLLKLNMKIDQMSKLSHQNRLKLPSQIINKMNRILHQLKFLSQSSERRFSNGDANAVNKMYFLQALIFVLPAKKTSFKIKNRTRMTKQNILKILGCAISVENWI